MDQLVTVSETYPGNISLSFHESRLLERIQSRFQLIEIYEHSLVGKILLLDGLIMFTEMDYRFNREMMFNISMHGRGPTESVLIIGGGDGSSPGEALKYPTISSIDAIDIDKEVTAVCRKNFGFLRESFINPRIHYVFQEGSEFVRATNKSYGVIIVSPTDPDILSVPLYTREFFQNCHKILDAEGILCIGGFSPFYALGKLQARNVKATMEQVYRIVRVFFATLPSYPGGVCTYLIGSKQHDPSRVRTIHLSDDQYREMSYYNFAVHEGAFRLPQIVKRLFDSPQGESV